MITSVITIVLICYGQAYELAKLQGELGREEGGEEIRQEGRPEGG